jgi:bacterioferritin (cytochrome b1)
VRILDLNGKQNTGHVKHGEIMKSIDELLQNQENPMTTEANTESPKEETQPEQEQAQEVQNYSTYQVIELLKKSLNIHWQQTTVLTAQAEHLERWGYKKLAAIIKADAEEEHEHATINVKRLEFFDADYQPLIVSPPAWKRHDMLAMINYNLDSVREAAVTEKATIVAARVVGDEITANMMLPLLQGSEDGIKLYEGYLKLIEQMGLDNFLTLQV